jgi:hypothetical protein
MDSKESRFAWTGYQQVRRNPAQTQRVSMSEILLTPQSVLDRRTSSHAYACVLAKARPIRTTPYPSTDSATAEREAQLIERYEEGLHGIEG